MTWKDATDALLQHFKTEWEALHPTIPIQFPNTKRVSAESDAEPWLRLRFLHVLARRDAVGGQHRVQRGEAVVNVFVPLGTGDGNAIAYGREIEAIWEQARTNGLSGDIGLEAPAVLPGIPDPDLPFWRSGVAVPFFIDHSP